jgi:hypothetical protein
MIVVGATFMAPVVTMPNADDVDHVDGGRAQAGPYYEKISIYLRHLHRFI